MSGAVHHQSMPCRPNATGITGTDPKRPPRPNTSNSRTSGPLGGKDDGQPPKPADYGAGNNPDTWTHHKRTSHDKTHPTGNKQRRGRPTATTRGRPSPYGPPHNPRHADHWRLRRQITNTTRRAHPGLNTMTATSDRPATPNLRINRKDNKDNIRLRRHGLLRH